MSKIKYTLAFVSVCILSFFVINGDVFAVEGAHAADGVGELLALNTGRLNKYANYQIYFFDQDVSNCIKRNGSGDDDGGGDNVSTLTGGTRLEKIWNYIKDLGISGLSDSEEAISGVLGNMSVETGGTFNPFIQNSGGCTGLIQWCKGSWNDGFFSYMSNKGLSSYYYKGSEPSIDESTIDEGIEAELDFLFKGGSGGVTADNYIAKLSVPSIKNGVSGARAYADLFLVTVENAYGGGDTIEDGGVASIAGHTYYQAAESRRDRAETIYNTYGNGGIGEEDEDEEKEENSDDEKKEYCEDDEEEEEEPESGNLVSYIKAWVWPEYHKPPFVERKQAYAEYMDNESPYHPCSGVDCGAFVSNIIVASGWDTSYQRCSTSCQAGWLASNWRQVDVNSLKLGDVGIKSGHVILYIGNISGFSSKTASASSCTGEHARAPTAGSSSENLNIYTWYRKP